MWAHCSSSNTQFDHFEPLESLSYTTIGSFGACNDQSKTSCHMGYVDYVQPAVDQKIFLHWKPRRFNPRRPCIETKYTTLESGRAPISHHRCLKHTAHAENTFSRLGTCIVCNRVFFSSRGVLVIFSSSDDPERKNRQGRHSTHSTHQLIRPHINWD